MATLDKQVDDVREAALRSTDEIGGLLRNIAVASESVFGVQPNEVGMKILDAMFSGRPLAPLLNIDRDQIEATFETARAKMKAGDLHGAVKLFRVLVMIDFYCKRHWLMLALCLQKLGLWMSAADSYCVAHVVNRNDLWPVVRAAECYLAAESPQDAEELLEILNSLVVSDDSSEDGDSEELLAATKVLASKVAASRIESGQFDASV